MFEKFDGTGRPPRDLQKHVLKWLEQNWDADVLCMTLPTGVGKSAILRAIQLQFPGTTGIVPSNALMDQYSATYPELNYLKGKEHYTCLEYPDLSCWDAQDLYDSKCEMCTYTQNRVRAIEGEETIFNPMSLYIHLFSNDSSDIVVVDEAHKLAEFANLLASVTFRKSKDNYPDNLSTSLQLIRWLEVEEQVRVKEIKHARIKSEPKEVLKLMQEAENIRRILHLYRSNPQEFIFYTERRSYYKNTDEYLVISPIVSPKEIVRRLLGGKKVILMSATLFQSDIWDLGYTKYRYLDMPSPIAKESRQLIYRPASIQFNYKSRPADVATYISGILALYPDHNTVVHVSYGWAEKLKSFFPEALFNTSANKTGVLQKFKRNGGVWFAAGCAEGIDLPGDECRLTIIPIILKSNVMDPVVQKQLAAERGQIKYEMRALKQLIQQAGRGTRGEDDFSTTIIGDKSFPSLIMRNKTFLPKSFLEAIVWRSND